MEGFLLSIISFATFKLYTFLLDRFNFVPETSKSSYFRRNKYLNILVSFTHSVLSSLACIYCYLTNDLLFTSPLHGHTPPTKTLVSFSWGYFLHDLTHIVSTQGITQGIVLHHLVILMCHGMALCLDKFVNFACVSLFCEINSVFLHLRQIMKMRSLKHGLQFEAVKFLNIFTFLTVRIPIMCYLALNECKLLEVLHPAGYYAGFVGGVMMVGINLVLLWRLLKADVFGSKVKKNN